MENESYQRNVDDLSEEELEILRAIQSPDDITSCEQVGDDWTDDHIVCVGVKINGVEFGFWCCGSNMVGHVEYAMESEKAKKHVFDALVTFLDSADEEVDEDDDEGEDGDE